MRKFLQQYKKEHGYIFPYILFIITLLFLIIMHTINQYEVNQQISSLDIEQYRLHTLYRMANRHFDLEEIKPVETTYNFPGGNVKITYQNNIGKIVYYLVEITTLEGNTQQRIMRKKALEIDELIEE